MHPLSDDKGESVKKTHKRGHALMDEFLEENGGGVVLPPYGSKWEKREKTVKFPVHDFFPLVLSFLPLVSRPFVILLSASVFSSVFSSSSFSPFFSFSFPSFSTSFSS